MTERRKRRRNPDKIWFWTALVFAAVAVFTNLGTEGIYAAQEGRTAIILRNMIRTGNYLEMQVKDGVPYEKPIGHYWLCLPTAYLGGVGGDAMQSRVELAIRIPSAFCALLTVLLAGLLAKRIYSTRVAAMGMAILCTMSNFDKLGRLGHIDMPLAAAFMLAMYFLYTGYLEKWKPNWKIYLFYVALGWGMLLKGPLVLLLAGLVVAGMAATRGRQWYEVFRDLRLIRGALIVLAISLPWYIYECIHSEGAFFEEFIVKQNLARFAGDPAVYRKKTPVWYYIPKLLAGALPWSIAAVAGLVYFFKRLVKFDLSTGSRLLLIWFLTGFVFFSFSAVKRIDYLLPLFPALALMTARGINEWCITAPAAPRKWWLSLWTAVGIILMGAFVINTSGCLIDLGHKIEGGAIPFLTDRDGMSLVMFSQFLVDHAMELLETLLIVMLLSFAAGLSMEKRRYRRALGFFSLIVLGAFLAYHLAIEPGTDKKKSVKHFSESSRVLIAPGESIVYLGDFNTELIYFMDRDNYRFAPLDKKEELTAKKYQDAIHADDRWVIAPPEAAEKLHEAAPGVWREHLRTIENHQYPQVLLERVAAK